MTLGDGWAPFALTEDELASLLAQARDSPLWGDRRSPLEIVVVPEPALDPMGRPADVREAVERQSALGTTVLNLYLRHDSVEHCIEQMEAFVDVTGAVLDGDSLQIPAHPPSDPMR